MPAGRPRKEPVEHPPDKPTVITPEVQAKLVEAMAGGAYLTVACKACGISTDTIYYWRRLLDEGVEHARIYADFYGALEKASSVAEVNALAGIRSGRLGWQGEAWFLERRFPRRWCAKERSKAAAEKLEIPVARDEDGETLKP